MVYMDLLLSLHGPRVVVYMDLLLWSTWTSYGLHGPRVVVYMDLLLWSTWTSCCGLHGPLVVVYMDLLLWSTWTLCFLDQPIIIFKLKTNDFVLVCKCRGSNCLLLVVFKSNCRHHMTVKVCSLYDQHAP